MKLRNKMTGEIIDLEQWRLEYYKDSGCITLTNEKNQNEQYCYGVFADMKDDWSDYIDPEPLIKDEKIRKAVRAWSDAESIPPEETVFYNAGEYSFGWYRSVIEFSEHVQDLKEDEYTIAELCGEEE